MLVVSERADLSGYTTLRLGGPAERFARADTADDVVAAVRDADRAGDRVLVLGGGSNLVIADDGFDGSTIQVATSGVSVSDSGVGDGVRVTVAAGEDWDQFVEWSVAEKLAGLECLSGIPGLAGASPIQNVGAYGQEVAATIESVGVLDRVSGGRTILSGAQCAFGYRTSVFKSATWAAGGGAGPTGRYVVLEVTFLLARSPMSIPVRYAELAARLGVTIGDRAPLGDVRDAVLDLRRAKGMVLDPADPDTVSAGSFFTNPVLDLDELGRLDAAVTARSPGTSVPRYPAGPGYVKVPAAWLIEQAGFGKGYPGHGPARISTKHTLALTNRGGASTTDLLGLARTIVIGVREAFGVVLANEPVLVGVTL